MTDHPILFSAPMVRAILEGRKTQTRRVVKPQPVRMGSDWMASKRDSAHCEQVYLWDHRALVNDRFVSEACPFGVPGDRLWVRETFNGNPESGIGYAYRATQPEMDGLPWRPSIHMPRAASRITLEVVGVRVERLNEISEEDAKAEGAARHQCGHYVAQRPLDDVYENARDWFADLWESINGPGSWEANPWVWVVEFKAAKP